VRDRQITREALNHALAAQGASSAAAGAFDDAPHPEHIFHPPRFPHLNL
jgi:hypothetical protein